MSLAELKRRDVNDLRGEWGRARTEPGGSRAQDTFLTNRASRAENVRYDNGRVIGRDGHEPGDTATGKMTTIYQWIGFDSIALDINRVVTFENGALRLRDLITSDEATAEAIAGAYGASIVEAGNRVYASTFTSAAQGASEVRVITPLQSPIAIDKAFMGPMSFVPSAADAGAGNCSAGTRRIGYIVTSRSGYQGKPSPYTLGAFAPISYTSAADRTIRLTISTTWPADAAFVSAVMSTTETGTEAFYLIPDIEVAVPGGTAYSAQLDISVDDATLALYPTITANLNYLTQASGVGPISPPNIVTLGSRTAYIDGILTYVSDSFDPEVITADLHILQLPGQRMMVTAFQMRAVVYLLGPKWTYSTVARDETTPSEWPSPDDVSLALGTSFIHGVSPDTTGDHCWIANEAGLWDFQGVYGDKPISYMNDDKWKRINKYAARTQLQIVDDTVEQIVYVMAPLDDATECSHLLAWSYARGRGPFDVDFALYQLPANVASIAMVRNWLTQKSALWVGPIDASPILIQSRDALGDNGVAIDSPYEGGEVFKRRKSNNAIDMKIGAVEASVKGSGTLLVKVYTKGRVESEDLDPAALGELPDDNYQEGCNLESSDGTVEFRTNELGARMDLESYTVFYHPTRTNR